MSFFQVLSQTRLFLWVRYVRNLYSFIKDKEYVTLVLPHQDFVEEACASSLYKYYWFAEVFMRGKPLTFRLKNQLVILSPKYAVLELHYTFDEYLRSCIKSPERALVRKAIKNDFYAKEISYDEY